MRRRRLETGITRPLGVAGLLKRAVAMVHRQRRIAVPVTPRLRIGLVFGGKVILLLPDLIARRLHIGQIGARRGRHHLHAAALRFFRLPVGAHQAALRVFQLRNVGVCRQCRQRGADE